MGRTMLLGITVLIGVAMPTAWPEAAPRKAGETTFTLAWVKDEPTLRAEGGGVKFFKRVGRDRVSIRIEVPGDSVELEAGTNGHVRVGRKGRFLQLQVAGTFEANVAKVQKLFAGSKALDGFDGLMASLAASDKPQAQSLRSSQALVNAVRGVTVPLPAGPSPAASSRATRAASKEWAEGPFACWAEYTATVDQYNVIFNDCISDYWWIPGWTAACGFQFALQSELAWFWLLSCSGGMPV